MTTLASLFDEIDVRDKSVKTFKVCPTTIQNVKQFVETWHYSNNVNGLRVSNVFALLSDTDMIGAMIYGGLGMANTWKKYVNNENDIVELRRLCCIDNTPKNTESYFIGKTLRWLKKNTNYKMVISYADSFHGHEGTIYKASNFTHLGMTSPGRLINYNGKTYHDKCIRTTYVDKNGVKRLKPFAERIKLALGDGKATYVNTPGKHIYIYNLR
jgi:hypothetical protein